MPYSAESILDMVQDLDVIFGKGPGSKQVPNDENGHAPVWKKMSIFWELPYWHILETRQAFEKFKQDMTDQQREVKLPSDYDRAIKKAYEKMTMPHRTPQRGRRPVPKKPTEKGKSIAQLGEQKKQNISPLKVGTSRNDPGHYDAQALMEIIEKTGMSLEQIQDEDNFPRAKVVVPYIPGAALLEPEHMLTKMARLNRWYMNAYDSGVIGLKAKVRNHYFRGPELIHIEYSELWQMFHQDALDKSLMSCWCL